MPFTSLPNQLPLASSLPKISFKKISQQEIDQLQIPAGVTSQQNVNFGFNDGSHFDKPRHYLRHVEPIESERNGTVEYDMDEQDQEWLEALNTSRRNVGLDNISYEVFEIIIDRLEKEWFDLMKLLPTPRRPNPTTATAEEDGAGEEGDTNCAICDDGECENSNAIVFCDGCNLAVHQDCYGIPYIPEGQWLCRKCTVSPDRAVSCILCPHEGGAFKQTSQGKWAHLLCAMWIPETGVSNAVYMEPIDSVERIPKARWKLQCYLCRQKTGACIQCDNRSCFTAFHVTCAQKAGLLLKSTRQRAHGNGASSYAANASGSNQNSNGVDTDMNDLEEEDDEEEEELEEEVLKACCHKHLPSDLKAQRLEKALKLGYKDELGLLEKANPRKRGIKLVSRSNAAANNNNNEKSKAAAAYRKSYRPRPFLVPSYILNKVYDHVAKIQVRNKKPLVAQVARFWSLKRERRRGAPLLKRLHLEPWTATTSNQEVTDAQKKKKLEFIMQLRADLERIRMLTELVRRREKDKLRGAQQLRNVLVQGKLFPCAAKMRKALERIAAFDRNSYFLEPVPRDEVPDYYEVITEPMDWETILARLDTLYHYESISAFQADVRLVFKNALTYNTPDTAYHRAALKIQASAEPVLAELDELKQAHGDSVDAVDEALDPQEEFQISEVEPSNALLLEIKNYEDQELRELMEACDDEDVGNEPVTSLEDWVKVWHRLSANKRTLPIISAAPMTSSDDADSKTGWKGGNRKKKRGGTRWTKPRDRSRNSRKNPNSQKSGAGEEEEEEANSDYDVSQVNEGLEKEEAPEHQEDVDAMDLDQNQNENEPSKQLVEPDQELLLNSLQETSEQETSKQEKESAVEQPRASPSPELSRRLRTRSGAAKEVDTSSNAQNQSQPQIPAEDEVEETSVAAIDLQPPQEADADVTMEDATVPSQTSQNPAQVEETEKEEPPEPTSPRSRTRSSRQNQETNLPEETPQVEPLPIEKAEPSQQPEAEKAPNKEQPKEELATATPSRPKKGGTNRGKKRGYRGQFASKASSLDDDPDSAEAKKARDEARKAALDAEHEAAKQAADDADGEGEGDAEVDAESSAEYNRKKRARIANPESLQVEDLDNWDTFIRFEQGWVLPEGSTRRRVPPPQRPPLFTSTSTGPPASGSKSTLSVQGAADAAQSSDTASNKGKQRASSDPKKGSSNSNGKRARASTSVSASTSTNSKARPKQLKTSSTSEAAAAAAEEPEEVSDASSTEYFERPFARNKDGHFVKIDSADAVERGVMFSKRPAKGSRARGTSEERKERRKAKARERAKNRTAEKRREREQNEEDLSNSNVSNSNLTLNRSNSNPLAFDDASDSPLTEELSDLSSSEEDQSEDKDGDETEEEEEDDDESVVGDGEDDGRMENESPEEAHRRKLAVRRERDRLRKVQRANQNAELSESAKAEAKHQAQLARRRERDRARREKQKKERERGGGSTSKSGTSSSTLAGTSTRPRSTLQSGGQSSTTQLDYSTSSSAASNSRSQQPKPKKVDDDAEDDNPADRGKVKIPPKPSKVLSIQGEPEDFSEQGTLVWAKMTGYPWFPAETYDENNVDKIPSNVLNSCPESADDVVHHLVRFFDNQRSWVWLPTRNLRFMFEDEEQDQKMLTPRENSSARRVRKDIREAYQRAQEAAEDNGTGTSVA